MRRLILVLLLTGLVASTAQATQYYVSNSTAGCTDSGAGTSQTTPWCTLTPVRNTNFAPGDIVSFKRGDTWTGQGFSTVSTGGNADNNRLTFNAYGTGNRPIFNFTGLPFGGEFTCKNWITIDNLEMKNSVREVLYFNLAGSCTSTGITITNSYIHDSTEPYVPPPGTVNTRAVVALLNMIGATSQTEGRMTNLRIENTDIGGSPHNCLSINGGVTDVVLLNNVLHDCKHAGFDIKQSAVNPTQKNRRFTIRGNTVHHVETGIFTVESADILVDQNIVRDGTTAEGPPVAIKTHDAVNNPTVNWTVTRNIIYNFPVSGSQGIAAQGSIDSEHYNNTLYGINGTPFVLGANTNLVQSNNLAYANSSGNTTSPVVFDGRFVNAAAGDFRLCTGVGLPAACASGASNAVNVGSATSPAPTVYACTGNCDLGYNEPTAASADTTPPAAPTGLSVTSIWPTQHRLTWTAPADADRAGYRIRVCAVAACDPLVVGTILPLFATTASGTITYIHTLLTPVQNYRYSVETYDTASPANYSTTAATGNGTTQAQALIHHWAMDQSGAATTLTATVGGRDGTLCEGTTCPQQGPTWITGRIGSNALTFAGTNDHVRVADHDSLDILADQDFTVVAWVRSSQAQVNGVWPEILGKIAVTPVSGWELGLHDADDDIPLHRWYAALWVAGTYYLARGCTDIDDGQWTHVAFTRTGTTLTTYEDGLLCPGAVSTSTGSLANSSPLQMGIYADESSGDYAGDLDEVQIYNYALSAEQIGSLYSGLSTQELTHWRFHASSKQENTEWLTSEDQATQLRQNGNLRVRVGLLNSGAEPATQPYPLECRLDAGAWTPLTDSCGLFPVCLSEDTLVNNGAVGTAQLTVPGGASFATGQAKFVTASPFPPLTLNADQVGELEYGLRVVNVTADVVVCCRPTKGDGAQLDNTPAPPNVPCLTVFPGRATQVSR